VPSNPSSSCALDADGDDPRHGIAGRVLRFIQRNSRGVIGGGVAAAAVGTILVNALYLQPGPHPAPIFAVKARPVSGDQADAVVTLPRPRPADLFSARPDAGVAARPRVELISELQRELLRRGFYDGPIDGLPGPRTDAAIQDFAEAAGLKPAPEPSEELLRSISRSTVKAPAPHGPAPAARPDPIGELIAPPPRRVTAVQRALNEFGYGPIKANGVVGPDTRTAIEKFERERKLPITGQISDRLVRELSATTGRSLE
jgi:peptidoglycan hydrolase-like protein with peptidoglycan-binding domain